MNILKKAGLVFAAVICSALSMAPADGFAKVDGKIYTIGTGGVTGVYYPAGGAICRMVQRTREQHGIYCYAEATEGSIYNLNAIRMGDMDMGIVQSDWQFHAYNGSGLFEKLGADRSLRVIFSLHSEPFTVVVRGDSGIKSFDDLKGKRVNVGNPGSGMRATMEMLMAAYGWKMGDFKEVKELKASDQGKALCDNQIDAMVYAAGHPNGAVQEVTNMCDAKLIPVQGAVVDKIINAYPFYSYATVPGGMYAGNPDDVKTFGVKATFVTSDRVSDKVVYEMVKSVFDDFDSFKNQHPVFANLDPIQMIKDGNTAPLHDGAKRYYKERGWLKE